MANFKCLVYSMLNKTAKNLTSFFLDWVGDELHHGTVLEMLWVSL